MSKIKITFKKIWKIGFLLIGLFLLFLLFRDSQDFDWQKFNYNYEAESETVNIGFISSLTGPGSLTGVQSLTAAQLAVDEINGAGGINGRAVKLISEDGKCTKSGGEEAIKNLIEQDIVALVGGLCSAESIGFIDAIEKNKIPTISHCSSSTELSGISDYFFRVYPSDSIQGLFAANHVKNKLHINSAAIVYLNDTWGQSLKKEFSKTFTAQNGIITSEHSFNQGEYEFESIWEQINTENPELVYFLGFDTSTIIAFEELNKFDTEFTLFGADGWDDSAMWGEINTGNKNIIHTVVDDKEYSLEFIEKMKERGVYTMSSCIPQAYDAVKILTEVIASNNNPEMIRNNLENGQYINGVSKKTISFDNRGDILGAQYKIQKIKSYKEELKKSLANVEPALKNYLLIF